MLAIMASDGVSMTIQSKTETRGAFRQVVSIDAHTLHADVSAAIGGEASAPSPHDYFDASLATCKALTACVVAKQRGFALERVQVEVSRDDSRERKGTYVLTVRLEFDGALAQEEKEKLHDLVSRCPIHKLMATSTVEIHQLPLAAAAAGTAPKIE
jgi:putative redox protein